MRLFLVLGERDRETLDRSVEIRYAEPKVTILGPIHARLGPFRCVLTAAGFRIWSLIGSNGRGERGVFLLIEPPVRDLRARIRGRVECLERTGRIEGR